MSLPIPLEHNEQKNLFQWLGFQHPHLLACSQIAGVNLNKAQAGKAKAGGYKKGFPDIAIMEPNQKYHGLFIEMKRIKKSTTSAEQKVWIQDLLEKGYYAVVCKGYEEARNVITRYLRNEI